MKILYKAISLLFYICAISTSVNAFSNSNSPLDNSSNDTLGVLLTKDSLQTNNNTWPTCPVVESSDLIILDDETYLLKWESSESSKIEYNIQVLDGDNVIAEERNNTGVFIFQLSQSLSKKKISLNITTMCYYDFGEDPIHSESYKEEWSSLINRSSLFCDSFEDLIYTDHLPSFFLFDTKFPSDANFKFDICQNDDCHSYDHSVSNSAILEKRQDSYSISNHKLLTKFGNFSCNSLRNSVNEICESLEVSEVENCLYEISYPEEITPACDLGLYAPTLTHSLCGHETGRIIIQPNGGNEPYFYSWSTGDEGYENEINHLFPGTYIVTVTDVTGCQVFTDITIEESSTINFHESGGDGGLEETLILPAGMPVVWKFDPVGVSDQFIVTGQNLNVDTGPITVLTEANCQNNSSCDCSLVFMGDYNEGDALPIASGSATKNSPNAEGFITVPDDGVLNLNVIGANCGSGTAWALKLDCGFAKSAANTQRPRDLSYVTVADEVDTYINARKVSEEQYLRDSITYYNHKQKRDEEITKKLKPNRPESDSRAGNTTTLDFRCSGFVAAPYTIRMADNETGEIYTCDIIDNVSCPSCNGDTEGCKFIDYNLISDPWDPFCHFEWQIKPGFATELEITNAQGEVVLQTADSSGDWEFEDGEIFNVSFTLENDSLSVGCNFEIDCPEPELPPVNESICEYFSEFGVSLENESNLMFYSDADLSANQIEEFNLVISQIAQIRLDLVWELGPGLENHLLFDANNGGAVNLFQLDPENLTFILDNYDMNNVWNQILQGEIFSPDARSMRYKFRIYDIYGNEIICDFNTVVEFPEEEEKEDNPLCLSCNDGIYDPNEDLEGYTLAEGKPYNEDLNGETVYMYGFPIHITSYSTTFNAGEGILSLPFDECKVLAVQLSDLEVVELPIEKRLWIVGGEIIPHDTYPGDLPDFDLAPDFEIGAEICVPPRAPNDVDGDGIDDDTNLDKYGFGPNGQHMNGTNFDNNGFDSNGNYMGCPREDDPSLACTTYNADGCDRDGKDENGNPCPTIDDEDWEDFIDEFEDSSDSLIATIICEFSEVSNQEMSEKTNECDSLRSLMDTYIDDASLSQEEVNLIKGQDDEYFNPGLSDHFDSEPKAPTPEVGGRAELIKKIEKIHVKLYYCDQNLQPLEAEAAGLSDLCSQGNTSEIQALIDKAIDELSNLDKQRLMLDENAFQQWIEDLVKEYMKDEHNIYIGSVMPGSSVIPNSFEIDLFNKPTNFQYQGNYNAIASSEDGIDFMSDFNVMDAIDFEYKQGFDEINGVTRAFYVAQVGRYNQEHYSSLAGTEPVAIQNVQSSSIFSIYLVNFRFYIDQPAKVDAYIELVDPKSNRKIYFSAKNVEYNPNGIEEAKMELATTIGKFKISNAARGTILKGPGTYLDFNCGGVKEFGLKGEVEFCDNIIVPMQKIEGKNDYERHDDPYFTMGFEIKFQEWLEFETQVTAKSPFAMAKQEDLIWIAPSFTFDFSSVSSDFSSSFSVPGGFNSEFVEGSTLGPGWKGFYCPSLEAVLPALTKNDNGDRHTALNVQNLLIDKYGVTCSAEVSTQILGLGKPNMKSENESSGWSLSIDYFRLDAVQNFIVGGGLRGKIITSLFKDNEESALDYTALILPGQKYKFSISPKVDLEVPLLVANAEIKSAAVEVSYDAAKEAFEAKAKFSGNLKIDNGLASASLPYLKFQNLTVMNKAPYIIGGKWELKSNSGSGDNSGNEDSGDYKGFSFSIENLKFEECDGGPILSTTINVGFGLNGDNSGGDDEVKNSNINISGDFGLRGIFEPNANGVQGFKFDKAFLNGLSVSGNIGEAVTDIDVKLCWDDDNPSYGDTFYGSGKASILNFGEVGVAAQFGNKDGEKYFFVDAFAEIPTVPIGGPIGINMIGAGVSNNMALHNDATGNGTPSEVPESGVCSPPSCASNFGQTYTGFTYTVDPEKSLAVKLSVGFGMTTTPADFVEGTAGIDITFNDDGGISKFGFFGEATIMAPFPDKLGKVVSMINESPINKLAGIDLTADPLNFDGAKPDFSTTLPIMARVEGSWDFANGDFDLSAGAFLDWGVLKGSGVDNALVLGKIHIGSDGWNISLGTPNYPSGVVLNLGIVNASFKTYFMAGNPMSEPWVPYLPPKVSAFFGDPNDFGFLETMPASGAGIAFGVHFSAGFDISVPILGSAYADLMAGIDVAMVNGIKCNGEPIGFGSGWYAMGQAYLYAGAGIRILGVDLIKGEAGIMMNAGLTNPSFFNGRLKVQGQFGIWPLKFNISGSIDIELGEEPDCTWYVFDEGEVLEVLGELSIVESTFPTTEEVDVPTSLSNYLINYTVPMGEVLELVYPDTLSNGDIEDKTVAYKIDISKIQLVSSKKGVIKELNPSDDGNTSEDVYLNGTLASDDLITVKITYNVEMKIPGTDEFIDAISDQVLEYNFTTGALTLEFDPANIKATWPENGMDNFYLNHRLEFQGTPKGIVTFNTRFPWEIFETPGIEVRSALYQGNNTEPLLDSPIDPQQYFKVITRDPTHAGSLYFDLPDEMGLGKNFKVLIYAKSDENEMKIPLMDPIHFRSSSYYNLEAKFAESDSMFYVEASPRIGSEYIDGVVHSYVCGYEFNLISKPNAVESWDDFDAKYMKFGPVCSFDSGNYRPKINSAEFVDCEFEEIDQPPKWDLPGLYPMASVGDILNTPGASSLTSNNSSSATRENVTGPPNVTIDEIHFYYKTFESLYYKWQGFLLKSCQ